MEISKKNNKKITTALLMASGMGTRIRPLSEEIPKPLIPVKGTPMIETIIHSLLSVGINDILITVGYQKEKYYYLREKYEGITFIENKDYAFRNTISSFYSAMNYLRDKNCIICESDLFISNSQIIKREVDKSRYFLREVELQNYEWGFEIKNEQIMKVIRPNPNIYLNHHMYGIAYWIKEDLNKLIEKVDEIYELEGYEQKAYDEIANMIFNEIDMGYISVNDGDVYEIDCLNDLINVDSSYNTYL